MAVRQAFSKSPSRRLASSNWVTIVAYERTSQEKEEGVRAVKAKGDESLEQKTQDDAKNVEAVELR
jgi:hypothetical protein